MADEIIQRSMPAVPGVDACPMVTTPPLSRTLRMRTSCYGVESGIDNFFFWRQDGRAEPNATNWVPLKEITDER